MNRDDGTKSVMAVLLLLACFLCFLQQRKIEEQEDIIIGQRNLIDDQYQTFRHLRGRLEDDQKFNIELKNELIRVGNEGFRPKGDK